MLPAVAPAPRPPTALSFKFKPLELKCFLRSYISLGECAASDNQETWVNWNSPSADWERHADKNCMEGWADPRL